MHVTDLDTSFLAGLGADDADAMFAAGTRRAFATGELLCREGDVGSAILVVLSGYVKLTKTAISGRETMLELRGPGEVLGDGGEAAQETRHSAVTGPWATTSERAGSEGSRMAANA